MSIFRREPSSLSGEETKNNHLPSARRTPPASREFIENVELEINRITKCAVFTGEYVCALKDGRIVIPWDIDVIRDRFVWMLILRDQKKIPIFCCEDHNEDTEDCTVLARGRCEFTQNGDWMIPNELSVLLESNGDYVWSGRAGYAELISDVEHQKTYDDFNADDLKNLLSGK